MISETNPAGTNGFAFVEFTAMDFEQLENDFNRLGFNHVATHKAKPIKLFRQGKINFLINEMQNGHGAEFAKAHGAAAIGIGFRVEDVKRAYQHALAKGAKRVTLNKSLNLSAIEGVGDSLIYFIDDTKVATFFDEEFEYLDNIEPNPLGAGLTYIDHLTHNVHRGQMRVWSAFYERLFNFKEIRYFDIKGQLTGLVSQAMTSPCGKIRIPINESTDDKSQIEEFIEEFNGEGIQHIALGTQDIYKSIAELRGNGTKFLHTPDTYFEMIQERLPWQHEDVEKLRELKILIDGDKTPEGGLLLQIFTENMLGPVFFEIIQRKGNEGFGEGNFQALFESIERDQMQRGKL